jgi:hypothetical protein
LRGLDEGLTLHRREDSPGDEPFDLVNERAEQIRGAGPVSRNGLERIIERCQERVPVRDSA